MTEAYTPVPTAVELAAMSDELAVAIEWTKDGKATKWRITQEGHDLLGVIMRRNAILSELPDPFDSTREERHAKAEEARRKAHP